MRRLFVGIALVVASGCQGEPDLLETYDLGLHVRRLPDDKEIAGSSRTDLWVVAATANQQDAPETIHHSSDGHTWQPVHNLQVDPYLNGNAHILDLATAGPGSVWVAGKDRETQLLGRLE